MNRFVALSRPLAAASRVQAARSVLATRSAVQSKHNFHSFLFLTFRESNLYVFQDGNNYNMGGNNYSTLQANKKVDRNTPSPYKSTTYFYKIDRAKKTPEHGRKKALNSWDI